MRSRSCRRLAAGLSAAVVLLGTGCVPEEDTSAGAASKPQPVVAVDPSESPALPSESAPSEISSSASSPAQEPQPSVPKVVGMGRADAEQVLLAAGFVVGELAEVPSARPAGTVLSQSVKVGTVLAAGSAVGLALAVPYPAVPSVVGRMQRVAADMLRAAGFEVAVEEQTRTSGRDGEVLSQTPGEGELAEPGAVVTIVVANVVRAAPPASQNCTPGYSPCLTPASDYDCAGGSGDGPEYAVGPIYVTGSDPYGLDSEGDGIACE
jgi:hypothetical protein